MNSTALWPSVIRELTWARDTLFFIRRPLSRSWSPIVHAVDASPYGFGVVNRPLDVDVVRGLGSWEERWRYRWFASVAPRSRALEGFIAPPSGRDLHVLNAGAAWAFDVPVPDVPPSFLDEDDWRRVAALKWHDTEAMHMLEARACVWSIRRMSRYTSYHDKDLLC